MHSLKQALTAQRKNSEKLRTELSKTERDKQVLEEELKNRQNSVDSLQKKVLSLQKVHTCFSCYRISRRVI